MCCYFSLICYRYQVNLVNSIWTLERRPYLRKIIPFESQTQQISSLLTFFFHYLPPFPRCSQCFTWFCKWRYIRKMTSLVNLLTIVSCQCSVHVSSLLRTVHKIHAFFQWSVMVNCRFQPLGSALHWKWRRLFLVDIATLVFCLCLIDLCCLSSTV